MVDFSKLLSKPMDEIKKPPAVPVGTYTGVITAREFGESANKKTPQVTFQIKLTGATDDVDVAELEGVDFSKKTLRKIYYLTDDATYRLKDLAESCGIPTSGRSLAEPIEDLINMPVLVGVTQRASQDGTELYNDVGTLVGA